MAFVIEQVIKGNRREIPGNIPPGVWWNKIMEYMDTEGALDDLAFYDSAMELLPPVRLRRLKAQVRIWREVTGEYPDDISVWWPIRQARKEGQIPWPDESAESEIDADGVLHCGKCAARWSAPHPDRCKLCGVTLIGTREL